jgi:hypothetical protein
MIVGLFDKQVDIANLTVESGASLQRPENRITWADHIGMQ